MPELPEVETVARGLQKTLPGHAVTDVRFGKIDFADDSDALKELLPGARITGVARLGKFICISLTASSKPNAAALYLIVHLGMTGKLSPRQPAEEIPPHTHLFFDLDDGRELRYTDVRRFGRIMLLAETEMAKFRERLGAEPLEIGREQFSARISARRSKIKAVLLNQGVLGGIGNIYADESLFRARIHPARVAATLSKKQLERLWQVLREVLLAAIEARGSSVANYVDARGKKGGFQRQHRVYRRTGKSCARCGTKIRRIVVAGRSTHFCPRCQPPPKTKPVRARAAAPARGTSPRR